MFNEDLPFREDELTVENMVEFGKMWLTAIDAFHKKTGDARLSNVKIKIVEAVTGLSPQAGLALRATLTANIVTSNSGGGQFNTTPPPPITGGASATILPNPAGPVDGGDFLEPGQGAPSTPIAPLEGTEGLPASNALTMEGDGAGIGPVIEDEGMVDFFLNNSPTNIAAKYNYEQLQQFAIALGLTIEPSHRAQQVAAIIKAKLKESHK
jgi:hypothetical protein